MKLLQTSILILATILALMVYLKWGLAGTGIMLLLLISIHTGFQLYHRQIEQRILAQICTLNEHEYTRIYSQASPKIKRQLAKKRSKVKTAS